MLIFLCVVFGLWKMYTLGTCLIRQEEKLNDFNTSRFAPFASGRGTVDFETTKGGHFAELFQVKANGINQVYTSGHASSERIPVVLCLPGFADETGVDDSWEDGAHGFDSVCCFSLRCYIGTSCRIRQEPFSSFSLFSFVGVQKQLPHDIRSSDLFMSCFSGSASFAHRPFCIYPFNGRFLIHRSVPLRGSLNFA